MEHAQNLACSSAYLILAFMFVMLAARNAPRFV